MRMLEHLLQYGEGPVRRAVPLAVALLNTSTPEMGPMDMLSRLSHDTDPEVSSSPRVTEYSALSLTFLLLYAYFCLLVRSFIIVMQVRAAIA
eukprot:scaffold54592_cov31-Prasinocladus_malaysianus.AAC.2